MTMLKYETIRYGGAIVHRRHGDRHRINGPAFVWKDGDNMSWLEYNEYHRTDGPAMIRTGGIPLWFRRGEIDYSVD